MPVAFLSADADDPDAWLAAARAAVDALLEGG